MSPGRAHECLRGQRRVRARIKRMPLQMGALHRVRGGLSSCNASLVWPL